MAYIDEIKEEIGYLKLIFSILIAIGISIIGWIFQNFDSIKDSRMLLAFFALVFTGIAILVVNKKIIQKIRKLKDLIMDLLLVISVLIFFGALFYSVYEATQIA